MRSAKGKRRAHNVKPQHNLSAWNTAHCQFLIKTSCCCCLCFCWCFLLSVSFFHCAWRVRCCFCWSCTFCMLVSGFQPSAFVYCFTMSLRYRDSLRWRWHRQRYGMLCHQKRQQQPHGSSFTVYQTHSNICLNSFATQQWTKSNENEDNQCTVVQKKRNTANTTK